MTGEQARWGYENLNLDQKKLDALGFAGVMRPVSTSCADHMGSNWARVHTWDGKPSGTSAPTGCRPTSRSSSPWSRHRRAKYAAEKKLTRAHAGGLPVLIDSQTLNLPFAGRGGGPDGPPNERVRVRAAFAFEWNYHHE
jgi:hypothetical protein